MITLELSVDETNAVLHALAQLPYAQVVNLIESIRSQAVAQAEQRVRNEQAD